MTWYRHVPRWFLGALLVASPVSSPALQGQEQQEPMVFEGNPGGWKILEEGQPPAMVHATVEAMKKYRESRPEGTHGGAKSAGTASNLYYHGGVGGVGVETVPKVYLVLWGLQWSSDPSREAAILESFYRGAGGAAWTNTVTQYCQGVAVGTFYCNGGKAAGNPSGIFAGVWSDTSLAPSRPKQSQFAGEAVKAAAHFGNTTASDNASVQYVIATAHGHNSSGFGTSYCAYHSATSSTYGNVAYTNLPYITDAGPNCGADFNNLGPDAGITIVAGHEMAETMTDQFPDGGWLDSSGSEIGDKCAWISSGQGASSDTTFSTGTFPVQSLWSNAFASGSGGCVLSYP